MALNWHCDLTVFKLYPLRPMTTDPLFDVAECAIVLALYFFGFVRKVSRLIFQNRPGTCRRPVSEVIELLTACSSYHDGTLEHVSRNQRPSGAAIADGGIKSQPNMSGVVARRSTFTTEISYHRTSRCPELTFPMPRLKQTYLDWASREVLSRR